jgi:histidinol-phosphate/aromatic aminotransferase/cobyric acid decarboxylase-like protein
LDLGVLVRDVSSSVGSEGALRVTVGTAEENDRFLAAMDAVLSAQ